MIRLAAVAFAGVLFVVPLLSTAIPAVAVTGLIALLLALAGIALLWRWLVTAAACIFLSDFAAALWLAGAPVSILRAAGFGLALLLLLQSVELAQHTRRAAVGAGVARSQIVAWTGFAAGTLGMTMLAMAVAGAVAGSVPFAAGPLLAAAGALVAVLALAAAMTGAARRAARR
jgi:hypothetical protein